MPLDSRSDSPPEFQPFLRAVAHQVAFALGADPDEHGGDLRAVAAEGRAIELLRQAGAIGGKTPAARVDEAARRLLAEPAMLAAFFQNLDLLFEHRAPGADAVSVLLMRVMEL